MPSLFSTQSPTVPEVQHQMRPNRPTCTEIWCSKAQMQMAVEELAWRMEKAFLLSWYFEMFGNVVHHGSHVVSTCASPALLRGEKRSGAGDSRAQRRNLKPSTSKVTSWLISCRKPTTPKPENWTNKYETHQEPISQWNFRINVLYSMCINKGWFRRWCESLTKCFVCPVGPLNVNHWGSMHGSMCTASRKLRVTHTEFDKKGPSAFAIFIAELRLVWLSSVNMPKWTPEDG